MGDRFKQKKYLRWGLYGLLLAGALTFIYLVRGVFLSFLLAVTLAYLLSEPVRRVENKGMSRTAAVLLVYTAVFIILAGLILYGMPKFIVQLNRIMEATPLYTMQFQKFIVYLQAEYIQAGIPDPLRLVIDQCITWLEQTLLQMTGNALEAILGLAGYFFNLILAPIIAYYLLKDKELFLSQAILVIPLKWRQDLLVLVKQISAVVDSFIRSYLLVSIIIGFLTGVTMMCLGLDFALMLGIFAGITNLIPYFGPFIGAVPAIALAFFVSKWMVVKVIIAFLVIQQIEASIISPKIIGNRVGLHPLLVILILLAGGKLFGLTGLILAIPVAAVLRVVFVFVFARLYI